MPDRSPVLGAAKALVSSFSVICSTRERANSIRVSAPARRGATLEVRRHVSRYAAPALRVISVAPAPWRALVEPLPFTELSLQNLARSPLTSLAR